MKKVHRVIKFNQNACLKPYIDTNTDLKKKAKIEFEKDFFKLMNNAVFGKTMGNVRKHRDIKLATTEGRRNYLVSEPNYHTAKFFTKNFLAIEMKKRKILMNKPFNKPEILMYEFCYDYVKPRFGKKAKLCYMNTDNFITYLKTDDIYKDIAEDVETRFDTSNDELGRPLQKGKNKEEI